MPSAPKAARTADRAPTAGGCPMGGEHVGIPVQGKSYNICAKCGRRC